MKLKVDRSETPGLRCNSSKYSFIFLFIRNNSFRHTSRNHAECFQQFLAQRDFHLKFFFWHFLQTARILRANQLGQCEFYVANEIVTWWQPFGIVLNVSETRRVLPLGIVVRKSFEYFLHWNSLSLSMVSRSRLARCRILFMYSSFTDWWHRLHLQ